MLWEYLLVDDVRSIHRQRNRKGEVGHEYKAGADRRGTVSRAFLRDLSTICWYQRHFQQVLVRLLLLGEWCSWLCQVPDWQMLLSRRRHYYQVTSVDPDLFSLNMVASNNTKLP